MYYQRRWKLGVVISTCSVMLAACAGIEVALVLVLRLRYDRGLSWPMTAIGIIAVVILLAAFVPTLFGLIGRRGRVVGLSFMFLLIDSSRALFSLLSLGTIVENAFSGFTGLTWIVVAQQTFNIEFVTLYVLW